MVEITLQRIERDDMSDLTKAILAGLLAVGLAIGWFLMDFNERRVAVEQCLPRGSKTSVRICMLDRQYILTKCGSVNNPLCWEKVG